METLIASLGALAVVALVIWGFRRLVSIWEPVVKNTPPRSPVHNTNLQAGRGAPGLSHELMSEGDFHSGPNGYSPNTAYPETQYGSGFDEDAESSR